MDKTEAQQRGIASPEIYQSLSNLIMLYARVLILADESSLSKYIPGRILAIEVSSALWQTNDVRHTFSGRMCDHVLWLRCQRDESRQYE